MFRIYVCVVAALLVASPLSTAVAQSAPAAVTADGTKPSRMKLTMEKLKEMKARWSANKVKLKACRQEAKAKGLAGDDRWFYMEDCMAKS
jgi:psiF repeat-containing protein